MFYEQPISNEVISQLITTLEERNKNIQQFVDAIPKNSPRNSS